jgi:hypothetical protein
MVYSALRGKNGNVTKMQTGIKMARIPFSPNNPDLEAVRQIIFSRLRAEPNWNQLDHNGTGYAPYVQYAGSEWEAVML